MKFNIHNIGIFWKICLFFLQATSVLSNVINPVCVSEYKSQNNEVHLGIFSDKGEANDTTNCYCAPDSVNKEGGSDITSTNDARILIVALVQAKNQSVCGSPITIYRENSHNDGIYLSSYGFYVRQAPSTNHNIISGPNEPTMISLSNEIAELSSKLEKTKINEEFGQAEILENGAANEKEKNNQPEKQLHASNADEARTNTNPLANILYTGATREVAKYRLTFFKLFESIAADESYFPAYFQYSLSLNAVSAYEQLFQTILKSKKKKSKNVNQNIGNEKEKHKAPKLKDQLTYVYFVPTEHLLFKGSEEMGGNTSMIFVSESTYKRVTKVHKALFSYVKQIQKSVHIKAGTYEKDGPLNAIIWKMVSVESVEENAKGHSFVVLIENQKEKKTTQEENTTASEYIKQICSQPVSCDMLGFSLGKKKGDKKKSKDKDDEIMIKVDENREEVQEEENKEKKTKTTKNNNELQRKDEEKDHEIGDTEIETNNNVEKQKDKEIVENDEIYNIKDNKKNKKKKNEKTKDKNKEIALCCAGSDPLWNKKFQDTIIKKSLAGYLSQPKSEGSALP